MIKGMSLLNRREQKELTKKKIFETSISQFLENGYENVTINTIVKSLGLSKGAFYHHFISKEAIIIEFYNTMINDLVYELLSTVKTDHELSPVEIFKSLFKVFSEFCFNNQKIIKIILTEPKKINISLEDVFINEISTILLKVLKLIDQEMISENVESISRYISTLLYFEIRQICIQDNPKDKKEIEDMIQNIFYFVSKGAFNLDYFLNK